MDTGNVRSYRTISNLSVASQLIERIAVICLLVLLDLSAAFVMVDNTFFCSDWSNLIGAFQSYLVCRRQFARTGSSTSSLALILCGVGSVVRLQRWSFRTAFLPASTMWPGGCAPTGSR